MIRPISFRDILLVRRLQHQGVSLDMEGAILHPRAPLWEALISQVPLNGYGATTYVLRGGGRQGFIQARQGRGPLESYLTFLAPALVRGNSAPLAWELLLEQLCQGEGERGVQRVFAKLPEAADVEVDVFRQVGFRVYTQEHIYRLPQAVAIGMSAGSVRLRAYESKDAWGVHRLYCMGAPRFVQQTEYLPGQIGEVATSDWARSPREERYVWVQDGEIIGYVRLLGGERGHWLHILLHPDQVEYADVLVSVGLTQLATYPARPVYCTIRSYESDIERALKASGFQLYHTRFLLVKHTTVRVHEPVLEPLPPVEGIEAAPTASARVGCGNGRREPAPLPSEVLSESQWMK